MPPKMSYRLAVMLFVAAASSPTMAQEMIAQYHARIDAQDLWAADGTRLTDPAAILRQDRANYHRFKRRGREDQGDPLFEAAADRARIPDLYRAGDNLPAYEDELARGDVPVVVSIYGIAGVPTALSLHVPG